MKGGLAMAEKQGTYGEFIAAVEDTTCFEAKSFIEEWKGLTTEEAWKVFRPMPLTPDLVICFAEDMVHFFRERINGICTEALYTKTIGLYHGFLREVHEKAVKLGVQVELNQIDVPLTPSEAIAAAQG